MEIHLLLERLIKILKIRLWKKITMPIKWIVEKTKHVSYPFKKKMGFSLIIVLLKHVECKEARWNKKKRLDEYVSGSLGVYVNGQKIVENKLRWLGNVFRRSEEQ